MSDMDQDEIDAFWDDAKVRAGLNPARSYAGPNIHDTVPPPAWSFGADETQADELLRPRPRRHEDRDGQLRLGLRGRRR